MRDRDDVVAGVGAVYPRDGGTDPLDDVDEAFAVRRPLVRGRVPEGVRLLLPVEQKVAAVEPLPIAEMLLGKVLVLVNFLGREISHRLDRLRRLHRAHQMTRHPDRVLRQQRRETRKHRCVAAVAGQIALPVDPALVDAHWGMANPPPTRAGEVVGRGFAGDEAVHCRCFGQSLLPAPVTATRSCC